MKNHLLYFLLLACPYSALSCMDYRTLIETSMATVDRNMQNFINELEKSPREIVTFQEYEALGKWLQSCAPGKARPFSTLAFFLGYPNIAQKINKYHQLFKVKATPKHMYDIYFQRKPIATQAQYYVIWSSLRVALRELQEQFLLSTCASEAAEDYYFVKMKLKYGDRFPHDDLKEHISKLPLVRKLKEWEKKQFPAILSHNQNTETQKTH